MSASAQRAARRRASLSAAEIVRAAIEILDAHGEDALTFRTLAAQLSTGAGAMYRHVSSKDELLEAAAAELVGDAIAGATSGSAAVSVLEVMLELFDLVRSHPWLGSQLARAPWQTAVSIAFEAVGERLPAAGVPDGVRFNVASTLVHFLLGAAGQYAASTRITVARAEFLKEVAVNWSSRAGAGELPFVHAIAAELADHDDRRQFAAGIDLILAGAATLPRRG